MTKHQPRLQVRVQFEPNRFSGASLASAYEQLSPPQSFPVATSDSPPENVTPKATDLDIAKESINE